MISVYTLGCHVHLLKARPVLLYVAQCVYMLFSAACLDCAQVRRCLNESNNDQTTLTAACSDCAFVWRCSNESNPDQTTLSAACSDFAQIWRCSNQLNHKQTTLTAAACSDSALVRRGLNESNTSCLLRFGETAPSVACSDFAQVRRCSNESNRDQTTLNAANALLLRLVRGSERFEPQSDCSLYFLLRLKKGFP